jgi:hypothetical protein
MALTGAVLALAGRVTARIWAKAAAVRNGQRLATAPIPESHGRLPPSRSADPTESAEE